MNKKFKIAAVAVSAVMAGSMVVGMVGCKDKDDEPTETLKYDVTLNVNIGDAANRSISFKYGELLSGTVKLPNGKSYTSASLKPAWEALSDEIQVNFRDVWKNASKKLDNANTATASGSKLSDMDIITDGASNVSKYSDKLLDLNKYLDRMENYKAFLDANPIVRLSLTSNTENGAMYYAPYFDGNNDIEKYELFKVNWVEALLNGTTGDTATTFKSHGKAKTKEGDYSKTVSDKTAITSWMGQTGKWNTSVLDKDGTVVTGGITVDYDKVITALADTSAGIGKVYADANGGTAYAGTSGNIVDIQNKLINDKAGEVTGSVLVNLLREYVKVAYRTSDDKSFYTREGYKLSDVFCGYSAAWDVDLYAALGRALVTNPSLLKSGSKGNTIGGEGATALADLYLIAARQNNMQRMVDTTSLVGQLYGIRGLESKNLYSYIGADGKIQDPRNQAASYDAFNAFHGFWLEGLVHVGASGSNADQSWSKSQTPEALSCYDYVNTQTPVGFQLEGQVSGKYAVEEGYNYTPVITPVSKWNDGEEKKMRFTESWRTTKDTGFCIPKANVEGNEKKLNAVLKFIDYMFSNDGQILLTYGPMASSETAGDGFWYNREATQAEIDAGTYFEYKNKKLYSKVEYGGVYQPHICENVYTAYYGKQTAEKVTFDGKSITYAGEQMTKPTAEQAVKKDAALTDTLCVNSSGKYEKISKAAADCFVVEFKGKKYTVDKDGWPLGSGGKKVPLVSRKVSQWNTDASLNYTNFARYVIGSALPIGNKLQSFEFQLTSKMGRTGALVVDKALKEGIIQHTENKMTSNPWYTVVPTVLPYTTNESTALNKEHVRVSTGSEGNYFSNNKNDKTNLYWNIIKFGYSAKEVMGSYTGLGLGNSGDTSATAIIAKLVEVDKFPAYMQIKNDAWNKSKNYYNNTLNK